MENRLTERESIAFNCLKAVAIFSVIAAHTVVLSRVNIYSDIISSLWDMFGRIGVVAFFMIGGFFYSRSPKDGASFWKKKLFRIIIPWLMWSSITYGISIVVGSPNLGILHYIKWIFGSGSWYYYVTVYLFFLLIFKWFYKNNIILYCLIGLQIIALGLSTANISTTPPWGFITDYLNPLHWIGYFSAGILIRRYKLHALLQRSIWIPIISAILTIICACLMYFCRINTYFNIATFVFAVCATICITKVCFMVSKYKIATILGVFGASSYCVYLLHLQIVQFVVNRIPEGMIKTTVSPIIGLIIMAAFVFVAVIVLNKIPFGKKVKTFIGL